MLKLLNIHVDDQIGWYNSNVEPKYRLESYEDETLAVLVLNGPSMFETLFLPFLFETLKENINELEELNDPIDNCLNFKFNQVKKVFFNHLFSISSYLFLKLID